VDLQAPQIRTMPAAEAPWLVPPANSKPHALVRVFCFAFAGGSALQFREWDAAVSAEVQILGIQLPGHDYRRKEPLPTRVHDLMATTLLSAGDMKRLFGAKADALLPRYHMLMGNLINRGSVELVANVYEHKYDAVDAFAADDPAVATALVEPHELFAARVRKQNEERGLRYDGYFVLDGTWKTVNQLGKFIDVVKPASPEAAPTTK